MSLLELLDHENQFFHKISVYLWTHEVFRLCAVCKQTLALIEDREKAFRIFQYQAGPGANAIQHFGTNAYLHTHLSYDAARIYASASRNKLHAVTPLSLNSREKVDRLLDRVSKATTKLYYIEYSFNLSELHSGEFILSENFIASPAVVRLQLRRVTRVGLALAAEIETTPEFPLITISATIENHEFQLRAGARMADNLRTVDKRGFWSDLYPLPPTLLAEAPRTLRIPCFVEMKDTW
jgi:hypothetical protein